MRIQVPDLSKALAFYKERLGLELVWKKGEDQAGLKMSNSDTEIVLVKEELEQPEVDLTVDSVEKSIKKFEEGGGKVLVSPFEIAIGKCSVIEDPWKNKFVILDNSKGLLRVDENKEVV